MYNTKIQGKKHTWHSSNKIYVVKDSIKCLKMHFFSSILVIDLGLLDGLYTRSPQETRGQTRSSDKVYWSLCRSTGREHGERSSPKGSAGASGGGEEPLETLHRSEWGRAWSQLGRSSPFFLIMVLVQMKSTPRFWCTLGRPKMTVLLITSSQGGRTAVNSVVCACGCREVLRLQSFSFPPPKASELGGGQPRPFSCSFRYLKCALERPLVNMYALKPYCWTK